MKIFFTYFSFICILLLLNFQSIQAKETVKTSIHIVRYSDGTGGLSEQSVENAMAMLNNFYANTNILFVIDSIYTIDNDNYANLQLGFIDCSAISSSITSENISGSLNIYFVPNISAGYGATFNVPGRACAVKNSYAESSTLAHEVGHCLGLYHTESDEDCNGLEKVVRIFDPITNCYPNCSTAGDLICDTPAQRYPNGPAQDPCGNPYPVTNPNYGNIMDIQTAVSQRTFFTSGQIQKMEYTLDNNLSDILFYVSVTVSNKINNVIETGTTLHIDGDLVNSGESKDLFYGISHTSKTDEEILDTYYKHHDWDDDFTQFRLFEGFNINKNHLTRTANFKHIDPARIKNNLSEASNNDLGVKKIKDPWWVDQSGNQPDDFRTLTSSNVRVFLNQSGPPLWNPPYYSVQATSPQTIHLSQTGKDHKFYFQNWSGTNATFEDDNSTSTGVVFANSNATASANLKGTQLSNNSNAFSNSSQRKIVRTDDGNLHLVYESMGHVWYERSTDGGSTWSLANDGKPLDDNGGKLPAIDNHGNDISIVWEENDGYGAVKIQVACFGGTTSYNGYPKNVFWDNYQSYSNNLNPVIAYDYNGRGIIAWENKVNNIYSIGIIAKYGPLGQFAFLGNPNWEGWDTKVITSTNANSVYPSITSDDDPTDIYNMKYYLAWQQDNSSIKYCTLSEDAQNNISISSIETPSGSYAEKNYRPSIAFHYGDPVIVWQGLFDTGVIPVIKIKYSSGWSGFWDFGYGGYNSIACANINNDSIGRFVAAWGGDGNDEYITSNSTQNIYSLSTSGDIQVSNAGSDMGDIKITSFDKSSSVKDFTTLTLTQGISKKSTEDEIISKGIIASYISGEDTAVYMFDIGGIEVDGNRNLFNDSFKADSLSNKSAKAGIVETKSFLLTDNSRFTLQTNYSSRLSASFTNDKLKDLGLRFRVNLIDVETGKVLEELPISPVIEDINKYKTLGYTINTDGIGNKEVKLRLELVSQGLVESNKNVIRQWRTEIFTSVVQDSGKINKENLQQIALKGDEIVKDYALNQNYPNPFNPSTIISYQIPKDGFVTLKIYDILGREITTLVNEFETKGKYNVNFIAKDLSSGVYLYQLKANEFSSTKKLILMK